MTPERELREEDRQLVLLSLARLALLRPGFDDALRAIAIKLDGAEMYDKFKLLAAPAPTPARPQLSRGATVSQSGPEQGAIPPYTPAPPTNRIVMMGFSTERIEEARHCDCSTCKWIMQVVEMQSVPLAPEDDDDFVDWYIRFHGIALHPAGAGCGHCDRYVKLRKDLEQALEDEQLAAEPAVPERGPLTQGCSDKVKDLLREATVRYSRDHGLPDPTPAFPYEVVFSIAQWETLKYELERLAAAPRAAGGQRERIEALRVYKFGASANSWDDVEPWEYLKRDDVLAALAAAEPQVEGGGKT